MTLLDAGHQMTVGLDQFDARIFVPAREIDTQEIGHLRHGAGDHRRQHAAELGEGGDGDAADAVQVAFATGCLGQHPGRVGVHVFVHAVGQGHDLAQSARIFAAIESGGDIPARVAHHGQQRIAVAAHGLRQPAGEALAEEAGTTGDDVDVLADQVAIHPRHEVLASEVDILHGGIHFRRQVIAQPVRVHADFEVAQRADTGAARLGHLLAADGDEAVHVHLVGHFVGRAGEMQHGRPEQAMEVDDVLADEMHLLGGRVGEQCVHVDADLLAIGLEAGQVTDWRVEPDVEILARCIGDGNAEIGGVARDVPVGELAVGAQPFAGLVGDLRL